MKTVPDASEKIMTIKIEFLAIFDARVVFVDSRLWKTGIWPWDLNLLSMRDSNFFCWSLNFLSISWLFTSVRGTTLTIS